MQVVRRKALNSVLRVSSPSRQLNFTRRPLHPGYRALNWVCYRCQNYHPSPRLRNTNPDNTESTTPSSKDQDGTQKPADASSTDEGRIASEAEGYIALKNATGGDGPDPEQPDRRPASRTTSTRTRTTRKSTKLKEEPLPKIDLPEWFLERAVFLPEELEARDSRLDVSDEYGLGVPTEETDTGNDGSGTPSNSQGVNGGGGPSKEADTENPIEVAAEEDGKEVVKEVESEEPEPANEEGATKVLESSPKPETESISPNLGTDPKTLPSGEIKSDAHNGDKTDKEKPQIAFFTPSVSIGMKYGLSSAVWAEIWATVKANLLLPKLAYNQTRVSRNLDCVLLFPQTPETNGTYFLDAVSEDLARQLGATLIRIDAEDVAEIAGDFIESPAVDGKPSSIVSSVLPHNIRSMGYDAHLLHPSNRLPIEEEQIDEPEEAEAEAEEEAETTTADYEEPNRSFQPASALNFPASLLKLFSGDSVIRLGQGGAAAAVIDITTNADAPRDLNKDGSAKLNAVLELMLDSGIKKRETMDSSTGTISALDSETDPKNPSMNRTIVQIRDFKELTTNIEGRNLLKIMRKLVYQRRLEGREIMILGNSATLDQGTEITTTYLRQLQYSMSATGKVERVIVVPPQPSESTRHLLERDKKARIREVNMRHLKGMITRRSGEDGQAVVLEVPKDWHFDNVPKVPTSSDYVWDIDQVHRLCLAIIGSIPTPSPSEAGPRLIGPSDVAQAIRIIQQSDKMKVAWAAAETRFIEERDMADVPEPTPEEERAARIKQISRKCNKHEKKLLGGVIDASTISTGFDQVRAAPETVEALKTLTSLSLLRPEAFSYGVLASDRIPGVLLYGPPGTGKTLLAKAVAKEGGATVLEVSGSEVYDMYVGEGEKNVKAIFSLAKKLSPCVVFIDEADAIFGARTAHHQRTSHRELINQFLKEWDGVAKMSAFIMVATNRPFDLDDAVLRRLPRRILIDLPTTEDRLAILKIHLAGEDLDADVDLASIASDIRTNLYSGSDLKNVAVAAALASVRDEEIAFKTTGVYPPKRLLKAKHFEQALNEITASISDDMGSLGLIRKFDEKYGDKKGRKKKTNKWGFGSASVVTDEVKEKGTGRVRN